LEYAFADNISETARWARKILLYSTFVYFTVLATIWVVFVFYIGNIIVTRVRDISYAADRVSTGNYKEIINDDASDEIGSLAKSFNTMTFNLQKHREKLFEVSRQAGMSEVATGILHNVGNVLNSINTSLGIIKDSIKSMFPADFFKILELLKNNREDIHNFLSENEQGKYIPEYFIEFSDDLSRQKINLSKEIDLMDKNISNVNEIMRLQQATVVQHSVIEECVLEDLIDQALQVNSAELEGHKIKVTKSYLCNSKITIDRVKPY